MLKPANGLEREREIFKFWERTTSFRARGRRETSRFYAPMKLPRATISNWWRPRAQSPHLSARTGQSGQRNDFAGR